MSPLIQQKHQNNTSHHSPQKVYNFVTRAADSKYNCVVPLWQSHRITAALRLTLSLYGLSCDVMTVPSLEPGVLPESYLHKSETPSYLDVEVSVITKNDTLMEGGCLQ